jgi:hypothetical protein
MSELFPEIVAYERLDAEPGRGPSQSTWSASTRALFEQLGGQPPGEQGTAPASESDAEPSQAEPGRDPQEASRVYHERSARLFRPGLAAGAAALARFEQAFGLVGKLRSLKRTEGDAIEFVAEVDEQGTLAAGVLTRPGERAWKEGKSFNASYVGGELHPIIATALTRFMARYDGAPFDLLLAQIVPDLGDEHMVANDYPESVFYAYASASAWRRFFEGTELYRGTCGGHSGNVAIIDHTDIECLFNQAPSDERLPNFFNTPSVENDEYITGAHVPVVRPIRLFTDIGDVDVIKGADVLVDEALNFIASLPNKPDSVVIQAGCLPEVTGDDIDASAARTKDRLRLPVVAVGQHNDVAGMSFGDLLERESYALDRPLEPHAVVLLGMPAFLGRRELLGLLQRAGVDVLATVLPEIPDNAIESLRRASVVVEYPWDRYLVTMRRLAERLAPVRSLRPRPPYGFENTRRWLLSIGASVDRRDAVEAQIDVLMAKLAPRWELLRSRARQLRVGFVIEHGNWRAALSAQRSLGLPMLELLTEMGFGIEILAYSGERGRQPEPERFDDIHVRWYRSVDELDEQLADPRVVAWYSEMYFDRRLTRNGKNNFSMRQFSMGFHGAVDTLESMLRAGNMSFYRSYGRYLGPAFLERQELRR